MMRFVLWGARQGDCVIENFTCMPSVDWIIARIMIEPGRVPITFHIYLLQIILYTLQIG
jgi:hypothetical protein